MASGSIPDPRMTPIHSLGALVIGAVAAMGNFAMFGYDTLRWTLVGRPPKSVVLPAMYQIGVRSITVVMVTGFFIGMVLAVQTYDQLHIMGLESRLGSVINATLLKELGPVLAATMLAGRVGSAMAAELGTMRVTEQIEALRALGAHPVQYLVVPRFMACVLLIPLLTAVADSLGIFGGWLFGTQVLGVNSFFYWRYSFEFITSFEVITGLMKSFFFGAAIALIACQRGFNCGSGAEGVGRAATESFVFCFVVILILDFFLGMFFNRLYYVLWPVQISLS
ncbi:MAG: ABC transporter permease [Planctomyces sp.]|nr:ABC transporter permease [Planctomyces sp.]